MDSQVNPLRPETFFRPIFEILPKIRSYRFPTHRHNAHEKVLPESLLFFRIEILTMWKHMVPLGSSGLMLEYSISVLLLISLIVLQIRPLALQLAYLQCK